MSTFSFIVFQELGNICDEHKDDLTDLVKFYRRAGGVRHLAVSPNVAPIALDTSELTGTPVKEPTGVKTTLGKENSAARRDHIARPPPSDCLKQPFMVRYSKLHHFWSTKYYLN